LREGGHKETSKTQKKRGESEKGRRVKKRWGGPFPSWRRQIGEKLWEDAKEPWKINRPPPGINKKGVKLGEV